MNAQLQWLIADGYRNQTSVWIDKPYKLLIIYDKPPNKNSEPEVETYYKTFEIRSFDKLVADFYCIEDCTNHYFGNDNPTYMYYIDDVLYSSTELENFILKQSLLQDHSNL